MGNYDFKSLSPSDFEELCKDLLEKSLEVELQSFTTGRDKGIDLRHAPAMNSCFPISRQDWIIQCKHYAGSRFPQLRNAVERELPKLKLLKPARYVLATSVGLTPDNVDELVSILSPYCVSPHDIFGANQINDLLRRYGDIERRHPKLWITSEAVLQSVLHSGIHLQGAFTQETIRHLMSLYVYTDRYHAAAKQLREKSVAILTGPPGVGKTTLAEMLLVSHLEEGWELVRIHQNVSEGLAAYNQSPESKQIFYYDDFLGQISIGEKLAKNEDSALLQLIHGIQRSRNKRFILTTREYILAQVRTQHEKLARSNIDLFKLVVECKNYSDLEKARMLANHLYFNEIPKSYIEALAVKSGYRNVIQHRNYNPRLIESMTKNFVTKSWNEHEYLQSFLSLLENPDELWKVPFEDHLTEASRCIVLILATCGSVFLNDLESAFEASYRARCALFNWAYHPSSFKKSLQELDSDFIQLIAAEKKTVIDFNNPSLVDFVANRLSESSIDVSLILEGCIGFEQVERLAVVLHVLQPRYGKDDPPSYRGLQAEIKIGDAIVKTIRLSSIAIEKRSIFQRHDSLLPHWSYRWCNQWDRLQFCIRLAAVHDQGHLRKIVTEVGHEFFNGLEESDYVADAIDALDVAERQSWVDESTKNRWRLCCAENISHREDFSAENIEQLKSIVTWSYINEKLFDEEKFENVIERLKGAVIHEVEARLVEDKDEDEWASLHTNTDELQTIFYNCDFKELLIRINVGWSEHQQSKQNTPGDDIPIELKRNEANVTVKSIFESLLDQ